jgi:hypothetical protein
MLLLLAACGGGGDEGGGETCGNGAPGAQAARRASALSPVVAACTGGSTTGANFANAEVEPWLAADPTRSGRLLAAWQQDRWSNGGARAVVSALSTDGGATWQRTLHPFSRCGCAQKGAAGDYERATDPWVDYGPEGTAYTMALSFSGAIFAADSASAMLVSRSTDGGATWAAPVALIRDGADFFNDKNSLTADPVAPGHVYAVWDRLARNGGGPTLFARSTDAGQTWEAARTIYDPVAPSQTIGNRIVVLPTGAERGTLVNLLVQIDTVGGTSRSRLAVIRSADRGLTWGAPIFIADLRSVGTSDAPSGRTIRDGSLVPAIAAGPDGQLWVAWQDARFNTGARDAIVVSRSADGGRSWSAPLAVNRVAGAAAFLPTLAVRADGVVGLLHYDLRSNTAEAATLFADAWLLTTRDGVTWAETHVAGPFDMAFAPDAGGLFVGDYQGLVGQGNAFVAALGVANADTNNRTEVISPLLADPTLAGAVHVAKPRAAAIGKADAQLREREHQAIVRAMQRRFSGWAEWAGARAEPAQARSPAAPLRAPQR